jgi:hypothetical protein
MEPEASVLYLQKHTSELQPQPTFKRSFPKIRFNIILPLSNRRLSFSFRFTMVPYFMLLYSC